MPRPTPPFAPRVARIPLTPDEQRCLDAAEAVAQAARGSLLGPSPGRVRAAADEHDLRGMEVDWTADLLSRRAAERGLPLADARAFLARLAETNSGRHAHALARVLLAERPLPAGRVEAVMAAADAPGPRVGEADAGRDVPAMIAYLLATTPNLSLGAYRWALETGGTPGVWSAIAKHEVALHDPACRALLARSNNPHVILALTRTAPEPERLAWLARLATKERLAARALTDGTFRGWRLPRVFVERLLGSAVPERREATLRALGEMGVEVVPEDVAPAPRPRGRQYAPQGRRAR